MTKEFDFEGDADEAGGATDPTVMDKRGLASFTGFTLKEIDRAIRDGLPTRGKRGASLHFSVPEVVQWMLAKNNDEDKQLARRKEIAIITKREAEAGKIGGTMVDLKAVCAAIRDHVAKTQSELEALPAKLPPEVRELATAEVHGLINRLASGIGDDVTRAVEMATGVRQ